MMNARTGYWFRHFTAAAIGSLFLIPNPATPKRRARPRSDPCSSAP